jgi:CDP-diacylglycerol--glycerol-3-phosphate 3-phosphatidyltransferase
MSMTLANKLTLTRILLIPIFIITLIKPIDRFVMTFGSNTYNTVALLIFFFAMFTDVLDGFVARKKKQRSTLGGFLDPLADKLFLFSSFVILAFLGKIPAWITAVVVSRDLVIVLGWGIIFIITGESVIVPSIYGKLTTFFQTMTILAVLLEFPYAWIVWYAAILFTIVSGVDYTIKGSKRVGAGEVKNNES